jgi:hypothetical protein
MSIPLPPSMVSKSKPVRMLAAVAAGSTALAGGLPLLTPDKFDWIGPSLGLLGLVITAAMAVYTEQSVTPWAEVAVKATPTGKLVAGPAAENLPNGVSVQVRGVGGQVAPGSATITSGIRRQDGSDPTTTAPDGSPIGEGDAL